MEKERLKFTINRFDHYYESVHTKGNIVLGYSTLVFGSVIAYYTSIKDDIIFTTTFSSLFTIMLLLSLASIFVVVFSSLPYLKTSGKSVLFFLSVSNMKRSDFFKKTKRMKEDAELSDLRRQTFSLACGLKKKYAFLKVSLILILIQIILVFPLILTTFLNLSQK